MMKTIIKTLKERNEGIYKIKKDLRMISLNARKWYPDRLLLLLDHHLLDLGTNTADAVSMNNT